MGIIEIIIRIPAIIIVISVLIYLNKYVPRAVKTTVAMILSNTIN